MDHPIIVGLFVTFLASDVITAECPSMCECSRNSDDQLEVDCKTMQLRAIPDNLPENTAVLIFSENSLGAPFLGRDDLKILGELPTLVDLRIDSNEIQIILPDAFADLTSIRRLVLAQNLIQTIPTEALSELPNLVDLDLSGNIIATLEDETLKNGELEILDLGDNRINSIRQGAFQGLSNLVTLDLQGNALGALSSSGFEDLVGLRNFDLSGNSIHLLPDGVFDRNRLLERLSLDRNNIDDIDPLIFFNLHGLVELSLASNSLDSKALKLLPLKRNLTRLSLHGNEIETIPKRVFVQNEELLDLDMSNNLISSIDGDAFIGLSRLEILQLAGNELRAISDGTFDHFREGLGICLVDNPWNCDCNITYLQTSLGRLRSICREATCSGQGGIRIREWSLPPECPGSTERPTSTRTDAQMHVSTSMTTEGSSSWTSTSTSGKPERSTTETGMRRGDINLVLLLVAVIVALVIICFAILTVCLCLLARRQAIIKRDGSSDIKQNNLDNIFRNSRLSRMSVFWEEGGGDADGGFTIYDKIKEVFSPSVGNGESQLETYLEPSRPRRRRNSYTDHELRGEANRVMMEEPGGGGSSATLPAGRNRRRMESPTRNQTRADDYELGEYTKAEQRGEYSYGIASSEEDSVGIANRGTYLEVRKEVDPVETIQQEPLPAIPRPGLPTRNDQGMVESDNEKFGDGLYLPQQEPPEATKLSTQHRESELYLEPKEVEAIDSRGSLRGGARGRGDGEQPTSIYADGEFGDIA